MVKHVGKRGLEAHSDCLCNAKHLSEAEAGRNCAGALQDTNSGVPKRPAPAGVGANAEKLKYCARD
jgi:hypothetical protein